MKRLIRHPVFIAVSLTLMSLMAVSCSSSGGDDDPSDGTDYSAPDMGNPSDIKTVTIPAGITITPATADTAQELVVSAMEALSSLFELPESASLRSARGTKSDTIDLATLSATGLTVTGTTKYSIDSTDMDYDASNLPQDGAKYYEYKTVATSMDASLTDQDGESKTSTVRIGGKMSVKLNLASTEKGTYERIANSDGSGFNVDTEKTEDSETVKAGVGFAFFALREDGLAAKFILSYAAAVTITGDEADASVPKATLSVYNPTDNTLITSQQVSANDVFDMLPDLLTDPADDGEESGGSSV